MEPAAISEPLRTLPLVGGQSLSVEDAPEGCILRLLDPEGRSRLTIEITSEGPVLRLEGALKLEVEGDLSLAARRLALHADERLELSSGGDLHLQAAGCAHSRALVQTIEATTGDVQVVANDRVRLKGELIKLNC
jgi:hypothetical protein